jgi:hypothetical protein
MRIIITENQYRTILKENKTDRFVDYFIENNRDEYFPDIIENLLIQYQLNIDIIDKNEKLKSFIEDKLRYPIDLSTPINKLIFLDRVREGIGHRITDAMRNKIEDITQGMMDEVVEEAFNKEKDLMRAVKLLAKVKKILPIRNWSVIAQFDNLVKSRVEQQGYTMVRKGYGDLGWTFEKGGGRIQQIIDYIKEQPKLPQKTRKGWMDYVGEDPNRKGWLSSVWRVVQDAGIIEKVRDGRNWTYRLGPNAEAFEQGKLIGF